MAEVRFEGSGSRSVAGVPEIGCDDDPYYVTNTEVTGNSLTTQFSGGQSRQGNFPGRCGFNKNKPRLFCTHCQLSGYLKENCYKLIGYPPGHKLYKKNFNFKQSAGSRFSANNVILGEENESKSGKTSSSFTDEQMKQIMSMIKAAAINENGSSTIEMAGPTCFDTSRDW